MNNLEQLNTLQGAKDFLNKIPEICRENLIAIMKQELKEKQRKNDCRTAILFREAQGLEDFGSRLAIIEEGKNSILNLLNNIEEYKKILTKIKNNQIITSKEHKIITDYIHICAYQSRPVDILNIIKLKHKIDHSKTIREIYPFVKDYPFVVDADEVSEDIASQLEEGMAEIWKNGGRGLVKKAKSPDGEDEIQTLFDHNHSQGGVLTFNQEEYEKYGLIKVIEHKVISEDSFHIMFLQREKEPLDRFVRLGGNYHMLQGFDKDGIGFSFGGGPWYYLIHKDISSDGIKINKISEALKSNGDDIRKGFGNFNTFETEMKGLGKVTLKKSYDESGNLIGIYAFKKKILGGEEQVRARDKKH